MKTRKAMTTTEPPVQMQNRSQFNGLLWIGLIFAWVIVGELAIHLYTRSGWTAHDIPVAALAADGQGTVWVVETNGTVWIAEETSLTSPSGGSIQVPLSDGDKVKCLAIDRQGQLWVGTSKRNVLLYNLHKEWITYTPEITVDHYGFQEIEELALDRLGRVWVRSNRELGVFDPGKGASDYSVQFSPGSGVTFTVDDQGQVWVIDDGDVIGQGEVKFLGADGSWRLYGTIEEEDYDVALDLAVDRFSRVWLGAYLKDEVGILGADGYLSTKYIVDDSPTNYGSPRLLVFDTHDRLWGTDLALFMIDADGAVDLYQRMFSGFPDGAIQTLTLDAQGRVWMHSYLDHLTTFDIEKSLPLLDPQMIRLLNLATLVSIPSLVLGLAWIWSRKDQAAPHFNSVRDFYLGLLGWFALWTLIVFGVGLLPFGGPGVYALLQLCLGVVLVPTVIGLIIRFRKRRWILVGGAAAFIINAIGWLLKYSSMTYSSPVGDILLMIPYF